MDEIDSAVIALLNRITTAMEDIRDAIQVVVDIIEEQNGDRHE